MKEIDFKVLQGLISKEIDALNVKYIIVFIILNLLIAFINWLIQKNVKKLEERIYKKKVREDKRITVIEEIYKDLVEYTYILDPLEFTRSIERTALLEKKIVINRLYIDNKLNNKITSFLDYTKSVASDFRKKDFKIETFLLNDIIKEFNK